MLLAGVLAGEHTEFNLAFNAVFAAVLAGDYTEFNFALDAARQCPRQRTRRIHVDMYTFITGYGNVKIHGNHDSFKLENIAIEESTNRLVKILHAAQDA